MSSHSGTVGHLEKPELVAPPLQHEDGARDEEADTVQCQTDLERRESQRTRKQLLFRKVVLWDICQTGRRNLPDFYPNGTLRVSTAS